jgi:hypothetical protein
MVSVFFFFANDHYSKRAAHGRVEFSPPLTFFVRFDIYLFHDTLTVIRFFAFNDKGL